jgi:tetratricopeptide (TPR) repeat protein
MAAPDELSLALPARRPAPAAAAAPAGRGRWLAPLFLALFAGLLASFPARNTDLWLHLAAGRELAGGQSPLAAADRAHWLWGLAACGLYSAAGGVGLALAKVLLVVGLALALLRLARAGAGWRTAAACTALALLAAGARLLLQPATASYLFLALALWPLRPRPDGMRGAERGIGSERADYALISRWVPPWPLWLLFVLWANVDGWFVLGLAVVALGGLGQALDRAGRGEGAPGGLTPLLARLLACVALLAAGCLLNPAGARAFAPPELGWFGLGASAAPAARDVTSLFRAAYWANLGLTPAGLAYFPLLALGLLSFLVNLPRWRWGRFLPWAALAALSAAQVRAVPFFAVVAGPALAWNLQELAEGRRQKAEGGSRPNALAAYCLLLTAFCLLVCAWPGWLQGPPFEPRRWAVLAPPALERGAEALGRWHRDAALAPGGRGLHLAPQSAQVFAWFCPEDRGLLDAGLAAALLGRPDAPDDWEERMRAAGVDHVVVYDADRERLLDALSSLLGEPGRWPLLYLGGDLAVFGWRGPAGPEAEDPFRGRGLDLNRLAFQPAGDKRAPRTPPPPGPERRWWEAFWRPAPPPPIDRAEATLHLLQAQALMRTAPYRRLLAWQAGQAAGLVGSAPGWGPPGTGLADAHLRLTLLRPPLVDTGPSFSPTPLSRLALACRQWWERQQDDTPPAPLYLAVRAARRALAADPSDARAWLVLGESYQLLLHATREWVRGERAPEVVQLRRAQASAALNRAVALDPGLAAAHLSLARLYGEMSNRDLGYLDLMLHHLRACQRLGREAGRAAGRAREEVEDRDVDRLAEAVAERERAYAAEAPALRVFERAQLAFQKGLGGRARDLLLESDVAAFGPAGMAMELELLLRTGRAKEVVEWTGPEQASALQPAPYHLLRAQALAAVGDYAGAEEECEQLAAVGRGEGPPPRALIAVLAAGEALGARSPVPSVGHLALRGLARGQSLGRMAGVANRLRDVSNAHTFRGLLTLEQGSADEAEVAFRLALDPWQGGAGVDFKGRPLAEDGLRWLEE